MFLITSRYQKARSLRHPDKPGAIYIVIAERRIVGDGSAVWDKRSMNSGITCDDRGRSDSHRSELNGLVRLAYCIIERRYVSDEPFDVDNVIADLHLAIGNDESMHDVITRSQTNFPMRADLVRVGNELKKDFRFIYTVDADTETLGGYLTAKARQLKNDGKISSVRSYTSTCQSLTKFMKGADIPIVDINHEFVAAYAQWLKESGITDNTQSFYLRTLRSALNHAAKENHIPIPNNLFDGLNTRVNFSVHSSGKKTDIDREVVRKIATIEFADNSEIGLIRDMFMFGFYCHGLELVEVLNLKKSDIVNGELVYRRRMTGVERRIALDRGAQAIVDKYKGLMGDYLFPMMERYHGLQHYTISDRVRTCVRQIGRQIGCPDLTFGANIVAWRQIMSRIDLSDILLARS